MSYLRCLCLFAYIVSSITYCVVFSLLLCALCCKFLWIVHSLTFIIEA
jgi:hypothetical protein